MLRSLVLFLIGFTAFGAQAQTGDKASSYPDRQIRLIVPFQAGSSSDTIARIVAHKLGERLGQQIIVDNRVGGSTVVGTDAVARAEPDGYTLGLANTSTHAASAAMNAKLPFDPVKSFTPIAMIGNSPFVLITSPHTPATTLQQFIALAKAKPGKLNYASAGTGTLTHLAGELFKRLAGIEVTHVGYRGSEQSMIDLLAGRLDLLVGTIAPTLEHIRDGRLRALATMDHTRAVLLPNVPTVVEAGMPGCEAGLWTAFVAPAGVSPAIVDRLSRELMAVANAPDVQDSLKSQGVTPEPGGPEVVAARIRTDLERWRDVVVKANIAIHH
jgi:tripartite-type tricarboxylate transporter receptor subunit TctC